MEISILLTILLIVISLGGDLLRVGKVCLIEGEQIDVSSSNNYLHENGTITWAVKLISRVFYMLNTVTSIDAQKVAQTILIQPQNIKLQG